MQRLPLFPAMHGPVGFKIVYHYTSWFSLQPIICTGIFPGATSCKCHVDMTRHAPLEIEGTKHPVQVTRVNWATNTSTRLWIGRKTSFEVPQVELEPFGYGWKPILYCHTFEGININPSCNSGSHLCAIWF